MTWVKIPFDINFFCFRLALLEYMIYKFNAYSRISFRKIEQIDTCQEEKFLIIRSIDH